MADKYVHVESSPGPIVDFGIRTIIITCSVLDDGFVICCEQSHVRDCGIEELSGHMSIPERGNGILKGRRRFAILRMA